MNSKPIMTRNKLLDKLIYKKIRVAKKKSTWSDTSLQRIICNQNVTLQFVFRETHSELNGIFFY